MSIYYNFPIDTNKIILVDSDSKIIVPSVFPYVHTPVSNISQLSPHFTTMNDTKNKVFAMPLEPYIDLNQDKDTHIIVTNSIYKQLYDSWIYKTKYNGEAFQYITIKDGQPKLITDINKKDHSHDEITIQKKAMFVKNNILSKDRIKKLLQELVDETKINWYDMEKNIYFVKEIVFKYIKKKLMKLVEKK